MTMSWVGEVSIVDCRLLKIETVPHFQLSRVSDGHVEGFTWGFTWGWGTAEDPAKVAGVLSTTLQNIACDLT